MVLDNWGFIWLGAVCVKDKEMFIYVVHQGMKLLFPWISIHWPLKSNSLIVWA